MGFFNKSEATSVEVYGQVLQCHICQHDEFHIREAQLNTAMATMFNLDWANASAVCYVCSRCGYIHWFLPQS